MSDTIPGDGKDNDCDARVDEEKRNFIDDDGDGRIDEDLATLPVKLQSLPSVLFSSCWDPTNPSHTGRPKIAVVSKSCKPVSATHKDNTTTRRCEQIIVREWMATDSCGNVDFAKQEIVVEDRTLPSLSTPHNRTVTCSEYRDVTAAGIASSQDDCDGDVTTWYEDQLYECVVWRTWKARDECGNTAVATVQTLKLRVDPPAVRFPVNVSVTCLSSTEPSDTGIPVVSEPDLCGWNASGIVTVDHEDTEVETGNCNRLITRTWRITDICGNALQKFQTITVTHQSPDIKAPLSTTSSCDGSENFNVVGQATTSRSCKSVNITHSDRLEGTALTRQWIGVDSCGHSSLPRTQVITIDEEAPRLTVPSNITVLCHEPAHPNSTGWAVLEKDLSESCFRLGGTPTVVDYVDKRNGPDCPGFILRQWRAKSFLGHTILANQVITLGELVFIVFRLL